MTVRTPPANPAVNARAPRVGRGRFFGGPTGRRLVEAVFVAAVALCSGCASAGRATTAAPRVPRPVADQSVHAGLGDDELGEDVAVRPRVGVSIDVEDRQRLHTVGARKFVGRGARRCYKRALADDRRLAGSMVFEVIVMSTGRVGGAEQLSTNLSDHTLGRCVRTLLQRLRFDIPDQSEAVIRRVRVRLDLRREIFDPDNPPIPDGSAAEPQPADIRRR